MLQNTTESTQTIQQLFRQSKTYLNKILDFI